MARNLAVTPGISVRRGDYLNRHDLFEAVRGSEYVFHLISTTTPASSGQDPLIDIETNLKMSVEVLEACRKCHTKRLIFASTAGAIYGRDQSKPFSEDDMPLPVSPYAITKLAIEGYLRYYRHAYGVDYVALRIANPYGARQNIVGSQGVIPIFMNLMRLGRPLPIFGDGSSARDYIYIHDVVAMILQMFERSNTTHQVYNIGSGRTTTLNALIGALQAIADVPVEVDYRPARPTDVHSVSLDIGRYRDEFGSPALTPLSDGLRDTWLYLASS
jgi:UDP-glucose 4-epimerase